MSEFYVNSYGLLVGPGVTWDLIPEGTLDPERGGQPVIKPTTVILHSQAGPRRTPAEALVAYMRRADITGEAHMIANLDGTMVQVVPFNRRADCNYKANSFAISFETQDNGSATLAETPWTLAQANQIANAIAAIGHKYGVPYTNPTNWQDPGVGYHSQYPEWSSYTGKTCPGAARIRQMDWVRAQAASICACGDPNEGV